MDYIVHILNYLNSMNKNNFELEKLFRDFYRALKRESAVLLGENGFTNSDFLYMRIISKEGNAQASYIAKEMGVRRGYVSAITARMEKLKLLQRSPLKSDGRGSILQLTSSGKKTYSSLEKKVSSVFTRKIAKLNSSEISTLMIFLKKMMSKQDNRK